MKEKRVDALISTFSDEKVLLRENRVFAALRFALGLKPGTPSYSKIRRADDEVDESRSKLIKAVLRQPLSAASIKKEVARLGEADGKELVSQLFGLTEKPCVLRTGGGDAPEAELELGRIFEWSNAAMDGLLPSGLLTHGPGSGDGARLSELDATVMKERCDAVIALWVISMGHKYRLSAMFWHGLGEVRFEQRLCTIPQLSARGRGIRFA